MTITDTTYPVQLGFTPDSQAIDDPDHPGLLRAGPRTSAPYVGEGLETHACPAVDMAVDGAALPALATAGFDTVDLSGLSELQSVCAEIREAGRVTDEQAAVVRAQLTGAVLPTASGVALRVQYLSDEGFIMRTSGPDRMSLVGPRSSGMNDHGGATSVHADQDVYGTPLTQIMDGRAPELFVHDSPDGHNHDASLLLVNLWIPLQQITQPLVLADGRSVDRRRHQLRYGLATDTFLERDEDQVINDIWTFLHDDDQRWYLRSEMDHRSAYVFNTLSTPHGCGVLPGEDVAAWCYRTLEQVEAAVPEGDVEGISRAAASLTDRPALPEPITPALRDAIEGMLGLLGTAAAAPASLRGDQAQEWLAASRAARRAVVRMSLEMRMVVTVESPSDR
jgi:hypothetical protein